MTKAAVYCRISRDRKVDGTHTMLGVERQEEDCRQLVTTLGWEVAEVFVDNDISATSGKPRPAYRRMLDEVAAGRVDAIVCWHPDRLYRRTVDLEELVQACDKYRVPIATVNAGAVDLTTPTGRLVAGLLAQVARYEGEHKAERWKRSYQQKRKAGEPPPSGARMFGWTRDGEVIPHEAEAIRKSAEHLLSGGSLLAICRGLNEAGVPTSTGRTWRTPGLRRLLTNPRLAGWVTHKGERVARSNWPSILDEDTFNAVQATLNGRPKRSGYPKVAILLGLVVCGECDAKMVTGRRSDHTKARVYKCPPRNDPRYRGGNGCTSVAAEKVEVIVEAYAQRRLEDPRIREELGRRQLNANGTKIAEEIGALEARLVALKAALTDSDDDVPEVVRAIGEVRARITEANERLAGVTPLAIPVDAPWPEGVERRRALIGLVVDHVTVQKVPRDYTSGTFRPDRIQIKPREVVGDGL